MLRSCTYYAYNISTAFPSIYIAIIIILTIIMIISPAIYKAKRNLFVCLLAWLSGMAGHALYGMAPSFVHTRVTFDAENDRPGPGSL